MTMIRTAMMLSASFSMSGCAGFVLYAGSRNESRDVIERLMAERDPELDSAQAAQCVVAGMTTQEIVTLGVSDVRRVTPKIRAKVEKALVRPDVASCIAAVPGVTLVQ